MIISDRNLFTATHLTAEVKKALREESVRTGKSMSQLMSEWIEQKLREAGKLEAA